MGEDALGRALEVLWAKLEATDFRRVTVELRDFLPQPLMETFTPDGWSMMRARVGEEVDTWLKAARTVAKEAGSANS